MKFVTLIFSLFFLLTGCEGEFMAQNPSLKYMEEGDRVFRIENISNAFSGEESLKMVKMAVDGMGFNTNAGPMEDDLFIMTDYALYWLDMTGSSVLNGWWPIENREFILKDGERIVNFLAIGENGDGRFPYNYPTAEWMELMQATSNGNNHGVHYGVLEASYIREIKNHEANITCNDKRPSFNEVFKPEFVRTDNESYEIIFKSRLIVVSAVDRNICGLDYLFNDGVRRPVYVRLGYKFSNGNFFERTYQLINGNDEAMSVTYMDYGESGLVGGLVFNGEWKDGNYPEVKNFNYFRPDQETFFPTGSENDTSADDTSRAQPGTWNELNFDMSKVPELSGVGWGGLPYGLEFSNGEIFFRTETLNDPCQSTGAFFSTNLGGFEGAAGWILAQCSGIYPLVGDSPVVTRRISWGNH